MDTRQKILDTAQRLIQTRSFHGFSFQDIADEASANQASITILPRRRMLQLPFLIAPLIG